MAIQHPGDAALTDLREAVNNAIKAGNSPAAVLTVVRDQLHCIQYFGHGDVDVMFAEVQKLDDALRGKS